MKVQQDIHKGSLVKGILRSRLLACQMMLAVVLMAFARGAQAAQYWSGIQWNEPVVVTPGELNGQPPSDAIVLFDGKDMSQWKNGENWQITDGVAIAGKGSIFSKQKFGDCQVHLEWSAPLSPTEKGQDRGNSGLYLMGLYEVQILDSYQNKTYFDGQAGAIYKQTPPMVNAMRAPGKWNVYDVFWTCPRFNDQGSLKSPAYITVMHNGVLILNHFELQGDTPYNRPPSYTQHEDKGPISLQYHGNPVRFRNIWVREIKPLVGKRVHPPKIVNPEE